MRTDRTTLSITGVLGLALITLSNAGLSFGGDPILDQADFIIEPGDRIGLIGRNGAGKSTLLKVIEGSVVIDGGEMQVQQGTVVSRLIQEVPTDKKFNVAAMVALGDPRVGPTLAEFYNDPIANESLQHTVTELDGWPLDQRVKMLCSKFELDPEQRFDDLSGGRKRRVLMAQALVPDPNILLLDEPTNHLDIDTILWLENLLKNMHCAMVIVSHDRSFIDSLCTRIVELDRGLISNYPGNYQAYLELKKKALEEEDRHNRKFDKRLAEEEVWIRKGIQARRTRNEGRVRALKQMRDERRQRRERQGTASLSLNQGAQSGKVVIESEGLKVQFGDNTVIDSLDLRVIRGDRIGLIGPNGCGKSTLIKVLTGEIQPTAGNLKIGTNIQVAYLDQYRDAIRDDLSVQDNVSGESEITINGQRKHILGYLQDFLFTPDRARAPAAKLSGGERNRVMLAKLFTQPFNVLVLDEPTNDLDYETLELLEQILMDFDGTLLLASHDRAFLDNIVTSTLAFEGNGVVNEYVGGYSDWLEQRRDTQRAQKSKKNASTNSGSVAAAPKPKKLSYKLKRELEELPAKIEQLEKLLESMAAEMNAADFYSQDQKVIATHADTLTAAQEDLTKAYARWEELEG